MSNAKRLSIRRSEFVSIRELVTAIATAEKQPEAQVATVLWNLLAESTSPPEWLQQHDGITYRLEPKAQETGWFALRALREGRECHGAWDRRMGFSLSATRAFFETSGVRMPSLGAPSDAEVLAKKREFVDAGVKNFLVRLEIFFGMDKEAVRRAITRAEKAERKNRTGASGDPFGRTSSAYHKSS